MKKKKKKGTRINTVTIKNGHRAASMPVRTLVPEDQALHPTDMVVRLVPLANVHLNPDNPNTQTPNQFQALVKAIKEDGFTDPVQLRLITDAADPRYKKPGEVVSASVYPFGPHQQFESVAGEHRIEALRALNHDVVPAIVNTRLKDKDLADLRTVRNNIVRGALDQQKFTKLYTRLQPKFGDVMLAEHMGFVDEQAMQQYIAQAAATLPTEEAKAEFADALENKKVKTLEGLSRLIGDLYLKYGHTVPQDFMYFTFGEHTHLVLAMSASTKARVEEITTFCRDNSLSVNTVMVPVLEAGWKDALPKLLAEGHHLSDPDADDVFEEDDLAVINDGDDE